jgi:hypothetical protein
MTAVVVDKFHKILASASRVPRLRGQPLEKGLAETKGITAARSHYGPQLFPVPRQDNTGRRAFKDKRKEGLGLKGLRRLINEYVAKMSTLDAALLEQRARCARRYNQGVIL